MSAASGDPRGRRLSTKFRRELLSGSTGLMLLGLLAAAGRERYGWEITKELEAAGSGLDLLPGTIYAVLRSLEREGLLESRLRRSDAGPARKYYRLTAAGRGALEEWTGTWRALRGLVDASLGERAG